MTLLISAIRDVRYPQTRNSRLLSSAGLSGFDDGGIPATVPGIGSAARRAAHAARSTHLPAPAPGRVRAQKCRGDSTLPRTCRVAVANGEAVLAGFSAAAVHGTRWIGGGESATLIRRGSRRSVDGIEVRADAFLPDEVCRVGDMLVTTPARTVFDLGRWLPVDRAVEVLDTLCHDTGLRPAEISSVAGRHRGERGLASLRNVVLLVDPGAESPPETRTRLVLIRGGLPAPETRIPIEDRRGRVFARADLGWRR